MCKLTARRGFWKVDDLLRYLIFAALSLVVPGILAQRLLRVRIDPTLILPCGIALCAFFYWLSLVTHAWVYPVATLTFIGLAVVGGFLHAESWQWTELPSLKRALPTAFVLIGLLALTQYRWNRLNEGAEFLLDPLVAADTAFHVGLTYELTLGYPP